MTCYIVLAEFLYTSSYDVSLETGMNLQKTPIIPFEDLSEDVRNFWFELAKRTIKRFEG